MAHHIRLDLRQVILIGGSALLVLLVVACGGGSASAPSVTAANAAASPGRPALASPITAPSPGPGSTSAADGQMYTVASGDTLATIAQQFYGDPGAWQQIYDANKDTIGDDPDTLKPDMQLVIPAKSS